MSRRNRNRKAERGTALVEWALCMAFFWFPLFLGTWQIGFNLIRAVQVTQICRDGGHMYSQGVDFSLSGSQTLLNALMPSNFTPTASGNTVMYFSTVTYVDDAACNAGGLLANSATCPNYQKAVFARQIPYGNSTLRSSNYGTPSSSICSSSNGYNISAANQLKDPSAVAQGFLGTIPLTSSAQYVFMSEMYVQSSDISVWSYLGTNGGEYAASYF